MKAALKHDKALSQISVEIEGHIALVEYDLRDGMLGIVHTYVPKPLEGRGIASELVRAAYDYAREQDVKPVATCSYAAAWLERNSKKVR